MSLPVNFTLYNSATRQKAVFTAITPGQIKLYVCGMTVYDYCHIGHARVMICFDMIVKFLRHLGWDVTYVRNITDIDDKIIARASENNEDIYTLTERFIDAMHEDAAALYCDMPDQSPKATDHIAHMQTMISTLIEQKYAYHAGDVYFAIDRFAPYGKLSGRTIADMQAGARVEVDSAKRHPMDFVLWKQVKPGEPAWDSPWGAGRPGWHIECSAMSTCCLGNHFDIHGGGGDLLFPHHENEIAQSEAATGEQYVNHWMHVGFVNVDGEKMSKSLGNFFTIRDVLAQFQAETVRYFIVSSHYRSPVNFSDSALRDAHAALTRCYQALKHVNWQLEAIACTSAQSIAQKIGHAFEQAMCDDFNSPQALAVLFELVKEINIAHSEARFADATFLARQLRHLARVLGLLQQDPSVFLQSASGASQLDPTHIEALIDERKQAKQARQFARADDIRQQLLDQGIHLEDSASGTTWRRQ